MRELSSGHTQNISKQCWAESVRQPKPKPNPTKSDASDGNVMRQILAAHKRMSLAKAVSQIGVIATGELQCFWCTAWKQTKVTKK